MIDRPLWGWAGTVKDFLSESSENWLESLTRHHVLLFNQPPSGSQFDAWKDEHKVLTQSFRDLAIAEPNATKWGIAFEYELPLEGGRRPDVVVLAGEAVVVLEFKQTGALRQSDRDQVIAYARDLMEYHERSHGKPVTPVLVLTGAKSSQHDPHVYIVEPSSLAKLLLDAAKPGEIILDEWLNSDYQPLPILIAAARKIFQNEPLPAIKRALSAGIPEAVEELGQIVEDAAKNGKRSLAFVTGVPGSGKTLAGLTLVYERVKKMSNATFLSGNGPLVAVLQDALKSGVFVRDLHKYIKFYGLTEKVPSDHVVVFDEAQRAWDAGYMFSKKQVNRSEPDLLIDIGEKIPDWSALVGLVGEGQEIHAGEEAGIAQWNDAVQPSAGRQTWEVHCSERLKSEFSNVTVKTYKHLDLTISLRSHRADSLHEWVVALLAGQISEAARLANKIQSQMFPMYLTRNLDDAKQYLEDRYEGASQARYGIIASSKSYKLLEKYGIHSDFMATKNVRISKWFNEPKGHPRSCCELKEVVTEFGCQGLELDFPLIAWSDDMKWQSKSWQFTKFRAKYKLEDPEQIRRNAYRVLLTRGRDGFVIFVPPEASMDETEHTLLASGIEVLPSASSQRAATA